MTDKDSRKYSKLVVDGVEQAPSRAMLRAVGFRDDDFKKPQIGIASTWSMVTPCNMHINKLAEDVNKATDAAGGKGIIYSCPTISDGISMGTEGMKYSLVSREVIAESVETVSGCMGHDGIITIGGCDKNMPGLLMGMSRLNRPSIFVYGGTIQPGPNHTNVVSVFEAVGGHAAGKVSDIELKNIEETAIPGPGSCGGMYTANTMASAIEAMGMSLPNSSAQDAISPEKQQDCLDAGAAIMHLVKNDIKPSDIMTRAAFENAIKVVIALGGSTNAVLHLIAMAFSMGVDIELDDFTRLGKKTPMVADLKPSGKYLMSELIKIGGIQPLMKTMLDAGMLDGSCMTVTGKTLAENLANVKSYPDGQDIIRPFDNPIKKDSHLCVLRGNLAPVVRSLKSPVKKACRLRATPASTILKRSVSPACSTAQSSRATSLLFDMRGLAVRRACAKCSAQRLQLWVKDWVKRSPSSPMAASLAVATASLWAMSRQKQVKAGRSR